MRLSKVCKIVGITRRALQEYDRIGLLHPSAKSEGGYWLYDEEAVETLMLIRIFVEAEYPLKTIKKIMENTESISTEFDRAIEKLEEKRKRITGMINSIKLFKILGGLPESFMDAMSSSPNSIEDMYNHQSFVGNLRQLIMQASEDDCLDEDDESLPIIYMLLLIGTLRGCQLSSKPILSAVQSLYDFFKTTYLDESTQQMIELISEEAANAIIGKVLISHFINDQFISNIDARMGNGTGDFIKAAVGGFNTNRLIKQDEEEVQ